MYCVMTAGGDYSYSKLCVCVCVWVCVCVHACERQAFGGQGAIRGSGVEPMGPSRADGPGGQEINNCC